MKKVLAILMCLTLLLGTVACASSEATTTPKEEAPAAQTQAPAATESEATEKEPEAEKEEAPTYEKTNIVFSFFGAETQPSGNGVAYFKDIVEERSGGAVTVEVYYNGTLYNQSMEYEALMKGDVDMIVTSFNYAMEYITELKSTFCPYMWVSIDHVRDFWDKDPVGVELMNRIQDELGVRQLSWYEGGYRNICLNQDLKVDSREALASVKLRSSPAENMIAMTGALGGNPIPVAFSDCYLSIETGVVNGLEVDLTGLIANGLAEVTKSVTLSQHYLSLDGFAVNNEHFNNWSPAVQELISSCAKEAADYVCELSIQTDQEAVQELKDMGVVIYDMTDEERAAYGEQVMDAFLSDKFCADYDMDLINAIREMGKNY